MSDARAVAVVMAAQELEDTGEVAIEEADIVGDWRQAERTTSAPGTVGVWGRRHAWWRTPSTARAAARGDTCRPALEHTAGAAIGTWLARGLDAEHPGQLGESPVVGMPVPQGSTGDRLLEALGFRVRWTSWRAAACPRGPRSPSATCRRATSIRERRRPASSQRLPATVLEDAFLEWSGARARALRGLRGRDDRRAPRLRAVEPARGRRRRAARSPGSRRPSSRPSAARGYVDRLAVRTDQRNRDWRRPCWWTPSPRRASTARRRPS